MPENNCWKKKTENNLKKNLELYLCLREKRATFQIRKGLMFYNNFQILFIIVNDFFFFFSIRFLIFLLSFFFNSCIFWLPIGYNSPSGYYEAYHTPQLHWNGPIKSNYQPVQTEEANIQINIELRKWTLLPVMMHQPHWKPFFEEKKRPYWWSDTLETVEFTASLLVANAINVP